MDYIIKTISSKILQLYILKLLLQSSLDMFLGPTPIIEYVIASQYNKSPPLICCLLRICPYTGVSTLYTTLYIYILATITADLAALQSHYSAYK